MPPLEINATQPWLVSHLGNVADTNYDIKYRLGRSTEEE